MTLVGQSSIMSLESSLPGCHIDKSSYDQLLYSLIIVILRMILGQKMSHVTGTRVRFKSNKEIVRLNGQPFNIAEMRKNLVDCASIALRLWRGRFKGLVTV